MAHKILTKVQDYLIHIDNYDFTITEWKDDKRTYFCRSDRAGYYYIINQFLPSISLVRSLEAPKEYFRSIIDVVNWIKDH
jgi:hypothetical protein